MKLCATVVALFCGLGLVPHPLRADGSLSSFITDLQQLSIDPEQTYRVRELMLSRGDIKIYLTEGTLAFAKPVGGRTVAAVFSTANNETGDAEILLLPPSRSERAALATFAKTPNLDEHLNSVVLFFSDETAKELRTQMEDRPLHPDPEEGKRLAVNADNALRSDARELAVRLGEAAFDHHAPERGFFYGIIGSRNLGFFDVIYEPNRDEPVLVGHTANQQDAQFFQVWCSFRPRRKAEPHHVTHSISDLQIDTEIHPDLSQTARASFLYHASADDGRAIHLELSAHLRVTSAVVDGKPADFLQYRSVDPGQVQGGAPLLLVSAENLAPETPHRVELSYEGKVVYRTAAGNYFVDERNSWYPFLSPMLTTFDLTFHCPENLKVASTGELVSDNVSAGVRTVHRKTQVPEPLAGFNIGAYEESSIEHAPYKIELFTNKIENSNELPAQAAAILDYYSSQWQPLSIHTLAISPIEGYFGQGFPGLIYLSNISFLREEDRPANLRNPHLDEFFSQMLLPHEMAHQWWGNTVSPADYRSVWLFEAMSNYAALEYLEQRKGRAALDDVLESYRQDLLATVKGATIESVGPVDFGERLLENNGMRAWHVIVYEKGAWILHMLRQRLGDDAFRTLQSRLLTEFQNKLLTNDDFHRLAASLVPEGQPDKSLDTFFENWIFSTGIPQMNFRSTGASVSLKISGVDEGFSLDLPLQCTTPDKKPTIVWVHAGQGDNAFDISDGNHSCQLPNATNYLYH